MKAGVKDGGVLLSVHCDSSEEVGRAKDILRETGAEDVASAGEKAVSTHTMDAGDAVHHAAHSVKDTVTGAKETVLGERSGYTKY